MYLAAWRHYLRLYQGLKARLVGISFLSLFQATLLIPVAWLIRQAFDRYIPQKDFIGLIHVSLVMLAIYLSSNALILFTRHQTLGITKIAIQRYRDELVQKIFTLSRSYYTQADQQKLHTGIVQDSERLDVMTNAVISHLLPSALMSLALGSILMALDFRLFLLLLVILPVLFLVGRILGRKFRLHVKAFHQKFENFSKGVAFILRMLDLTQLQTAEDLELKRQRQSHLDLRVTSGRMAWLGTAYSLSQNMIIVSASLVILVFGGRAVIQGTISLGDLLAFYFAFGLLREHLRVVYNSIPEILSGSESLLNLFRLMTIQEAHPYRGTRRIDFQGHLEIKKVDFRYESDPILREINLRIEPGQTVALIGPSGAGKSTILNLLLGFYRPEQGTIFADGVSFEDLEMIHLRRQIGILLQDPMLFPGTIRENIGYGMKDPSQSEIQRAAELALAHDFIRELPKAYDSPLGEAGVLLSGGQGQRIALARALLKNPALLILDEPTNHLDTLAVHGIRENIKTHLKGLSILVVSHDERMVREADWIYLLENGRVSEAGTPQELEGSAAYRRLFPFPQRASGEKD